VSGQSAFALRLGAKLQLGENPPKVWVFDLKDGQAWEERTEGNLRFRFNVTPIDKKRATIHVEIFEKGKQTPLSRPEIKALWGETAEAIEALENHPVHLWLRPTEK
jgi:hypothetical protein